MQEIAGVEVQLFSDGGAARNSYSDVMVYLARTSRA